ncbi:MAG: MraY family glycosyltransferase [Candidatus Paceibacterota bacterium]|jgi:UDP-GlcNAc:undecaprenyl-phosphate GlcNAc-1-phosphate transferase
MLYFILLPLAISVFLMPLLKRISLRYRLYDEPGQDRLKIHPKPISYLGGVGMFVSFSFTIAISIILNGIALSYGSGILLAGAIIIILGIMDDWKWKKGESRPLLKLLWQMLSTLAVILILIKVGVPFNFSVNPILGAIIASFYIVGAMNAMNMEDGMDGLAGGISIISLIGFVVISTTAQNSVVTLLSIVLMGSILGFLIYNWHPATIFMGDNGSHFLGFSLAMLAVLLSSDPLIHPGRFFGPLLIIGLPIIDTAFAITRRAINKKPIFMGDRSHLYDIVHKHGFGIPATVLICCVTQTIIVLGGILIFNL